MTKVDRKSVSAAIAEDDGTWCKDCRAPLTPGDDEVGDGVCWHCRSYREDIAAGVFDTLEDAL